MSLRHILNLLALAAAYTWTSLLFCHAHAAVQNFQQRLPELPILPPEFAGDVPGADRRFDGYQEHEFTLRHIYHHGTHKYPDLHRRIDIAKGASVRVASEDGFPEEAMPVLRARSNAIQIQRLADRSHERIDALLDAGRHRGKPSVLGASEWTIDEVPGPDVTNKETVVTFARIAANAYVTEHEDPEWEPVKGGFNYTEDFGWANDGLRGHIFANTNNDTVIIGLKGTSPAVFDGSDTTTNDKLNDNLFFSCCCGQGGHFWWKQVCDCQTSEFRCNSTCVVEALRNKNRYYYAAQEIYRNVSNIYPDAHVWLSGHSLGGAVSALVGLTYGIPVMTFEAPGDAMAASRLGLPTPPGYNYGFHQEREMTGIYQIGHTADPIFVGSCNTIGSACTIGGYAMQSRCHTGEVCEYDTVRDFRWRVGVANHRVKVMLRSVIEKYPEVAKCVPMKNCTDCYNWEYYESHSSSVSSRSSHTSTTMSRRRTTTCKTPGWFGCLDESTTTVTTTVTTGSTTKTLTTTTTCETPGWFGCNDKTTAVETMSAPTGPRSTSALPPVTTTSTIAVTSKASLAPTASSTSSSSPTTSSSSSSSSTSCATPGWFGCKDATTTTLQSSTLTSSTHTTETQDTISPPIKNPAAIKTCVSRSWWGYCQRWDIRDAESAERLEF